MIIYVLALVLLACVNMKYSGKNRSNIDYIAKDSTQPVKGIFIMLVFASHFAPYVELTGVLSKPYLVLREDLGQLVVVPFLFYSGFGIAESIRVKGYTYIQKMPVRRILNVLFQFDIAILIFWAVQILRGNRVPLLRILQALVGWESIGNSNWYILAILLLYLISYLVCAGLSDGKTFTRRKESGWLITILSVCLIWVLERHRPSYYYNTILAYAAGYLYAIYRQKMEDLLFDNDRTYLLLLGVLCILFYIFRKSWSGNLPAYELAAAIFGLIVVLFTMKFQINSRILSYCGEHLFSLYILQRLPMTLLKNTSLGENIPVYFISCLVISFGLSWIFDQLVPKLWIKIEKKLLPA